MSEQLGSYMKSQGTTSNKKRKTTPKKKKVVAKKKVPATPKEFTGIRAKIGRKVVELTWDSRQWILNIGSEGPFYYPRLVDMYNKLHGEVLRSKAKTASFDAAKLKRTAKDAEDLFYKLAYDLCKRLDVAREGEEDPS